MKHTPIHDNANMDLLALVPRDVRRLVDVGCMGGSLAREYRKINPRCEYIGIEIEPEYADVARVHCDKVIVGNIEHMEDAVFASLFPSDCWIFSDVLEHLYDPWSVLRRIRASLLPDASVLACIPNAQYWKLQLRLNRGDFHYEDEGLLDRTHIRWFTKTTIIELFQTTGFTILEGGARVTIADEPERDETLNGIRLLAEAVGGDANIAVQNATVFQWIMRATPTS
jgi:2-polyprenyl-3-methyl-5-hydroxy-6-metoxy-1,4-benzoquinol methylase